MFAEQLTGCRIEQANNAAVPLRVDLPADPAGRGRVVRGFDLDVAVEVDGALPELVVAERLDGQLLQRGLLLGEHRGNLALRRPVDARVGPALLPAVEVRLRRLEFLEAQPLKRSLL